jgi:gliding motility-associated-like protein
MKLLRQIAMMFLTVVLSGTLSGQDEIRPLSPVLDMVTVDPATGFATLRWIPSTSPDVGSYVVYIDEGATAPAIDTIRSPFITEYTHTASAARYRSVTYVVAAIDSSLNVSPLSNPLSTVWLLAVNDACNGKITVTWTPYANQRHPATSQVLHITSGSGSFISDQNLQPSEESYSFTGYEPDTEYCFHVTANDGSGSLSSSNRACVTTGSEAAPSWISIDAIAVEGGGITASAGYDQASDMVNYRLLRYNPVISLWEQAASATGAAGRVLFTVPSADTATVRLYRVAAVNSCGLDATLSEPARNILLEAASTGIRIELQWNRPLPGGAELYSVWRNAGEGMQEVAQALTDTVWSEEYATVAMDMSASAVIYRVTASDPSLPPGTPFHRSSAASIEGTDNVYMPNAFTPGRGGENAFFRPEFAFIPGEYDFRVYSRNGLLLFSTTDHGEGWDGRYNGTPMPSGVYLWSLRIMAPSGRRVIRNGTVTILP